MDVYDRILIRFLSRDFCDALLTEAVSSRLFMRILSHSYGFPKKADSTIRSRKMIQASKYCKMNVSSGCDLYILVHRSSLFLSHILCIYCFNMYEKLKISILRSLEFSNPEILLLLFFIRNINFFLFQIIFISRHLAFHWN